jgi:hypothetical protein
MAKYDFNCSSCGITQEILMPMATATFDPRPCPCGQLARHVVYAPAIVTGNSTPAKTSVDIAVGKSADEKWANIHRRQEVRDKIRKDTGSLGLSSPDGKTYTPLSKDKKEIRTRVTDAVSEQGYKPTYEGGDSKLVQ